MFEINDSLIIAELAVNHNQHIVDTFLMLSYLAGFFLMCIYCFQQRVHFFFILFPTPTI